MNLFVGTSGWQYASWKQSFYTQAPQKLWLERYCEAFPTVEVNNAFYRLPNKKTFADWYERTPESFVFAVKMSRYLTHIKRLRSPAQPISLFLQRSEPLAEKLGPVLLQLPPSMKIDLDVLGETLRQFPHDIKVTVEFRHPTWFVDETRSLLEKFGTALCLTDRLQKKSPLWRTADWGYLRLHEGRANPKPCYGREALETWVHHLQDLWPHDEQVFVYFNNDANACAPANAKVFEDLANT